VKINEYCVGLRSDMLEMVRTSLQGTCWDTLRALIEYFSLQWPDVAARIAKRTKNLPSEKVGGKRKSNGSGEAPPLNPY
jgi:hypothetical protein